MRTLKIRDFGPLAKAEIKLGKSNLIIGLQSSGKSCVLKTACFCSWVEKRIELAQSADDFLKGTHFIDTLANYHGMRDYICNNTYIAYETPRLGFTYDHAKRQFSFNWKDNRWDYQRPKISYIPSDRNLVEAIPMWSRLELENSNLLDFMADWNTARNAINQIDNVLELGLSYRYDALANTDSIVLPSGKAIRLSEGSSGVQSLMPLFVHLSYLFTPSFGSTKGTKQNYEQKEEEKRLTSLIANHLNEGEKALSEGNASIVRKNGFSFYFGSSQIAKRFEKKLSEYLLANHNEVYLEEPEDNLFPPTQCRLVEWLLEKTMKRKDMLFVATHSPYVLNQFIKSNAKSFYLFITYPDHDSGRFSVKSLSTKEIQDVYANGVDLFFNFEAYL